MNKVNSTKKIACIVLAFFLVIVSVILLIPHNAYADNVGTENTDEGNGFYNLEGYTEHTTLYKLFDFVYVHTYITLNYGFYVPVVQTGNSNQYTYADKIVIYASYYAVNPSSSSNIETSYLYYVVPFSSLSKGNAQNTNFVYGVPGGIANTMLSNALLDFAFYSPNINKATLYELLTKNGILNDGVGTSVYKTTFKQLSSNSDENYTGVDGYAGCFYLNNSDDFILSFAFSNSGLLPMSIISNNVIVKFQTTTLSYQTDNFIKYISTSLYLLNGYESIVNELKENYYDQWYGSGYNAGYNQATSDSESLWGYIKAIGEVPFIFVGSWLNFELMGVNMRDFVTAILSTCLVIAVVKLLI